MKRVYCDGALTKQTLAAQLDQGFVLVGAVRHGFTGGDIALFRPGSREEIEKCRNLMAAAKQESV